MLDRDLRCALISSQPRPSVHQKPRIVQVDIDQTDTWTRYRRGLCEGCAANCCTMPVEVRLTDLVRLGLVDAFEAEHEAPKQIARRLERAGFIDHFSFRYSVFTLARRSSGDCRFLDAESRRCTVYEQRPDTCRRHPQAGPRPGYCAFEPAASGERTASPRMLVSPR